MRLSAKTYPYLFAALWLLLSCRSAKLDDARAQLLRGEYHAASETYRQVYRSIKPGQRALRGVVAYELAEASRQVNAVPRAVTAYANAIRYGYPDTVMHLRYAQMLHKEGRYEAAQAAYEHYLQQVPTDAVARSGLEGTVRAARWLTEPTCYRVGRMDLFNSNRGEFSPAFAPGDALLYLTSSRNDARGDTLSRITGMKNNDLFVATRDSEGDWQHPVPLESEVNTVYDEGTASISADGNYLYYTFSPVGSDRQDRPAIYYSQRGIDNWNAGRELVIDASDTLSLFAHPSVSPSGCYLYYVSDRPGGYGGKDIWRSGIDGHRVLFSENLGPAINTPGDELFPYSASDSTLYFSSDGHPGLGGLDLFEASASAGAGEWEVKNMGWPVNSSMDDFGMAVEQDRRRGFFSSNRDDARGRDHIFRFEYLEPRVFVEGFAVDRDDRFIGEARVTVIDDHGGRYEYTTRPDGTYRFPARRGADYLFLATADGFLNLRQRLTTSPAEKDTVYFVDFEMTPYHKPVILENIFYDFDRASLRPESKEELDQLIGLLEENPSTTIELSAHTDRKGSDAYNRELSLRRAQSVTRYLVGRGINARRLSSVGYGKARPRRVSKAQSGDHTFLNEGDLLDETFIEQLTPAQQAVADQLNRRTEFEVTGDTFGLY